MGRTLAKLLVFFTVGAVLMAAGLEGAARLWAPALPPLAVMTGAVSSQPHQKRAKEDEPPAAPAAKWNVVWASPTPPAVGALATTMSAALGEQVRVTHVGQAHDTAAGLLCRLRHVLDAATPSMVVIDAWGETAPEVLRAHDLNAPCIFDEDNIARTQLPAGPWDETFSASVAYQTARLTLATDNLPQPSPGARQQAISKIAAIALEKGADPIVVTHGETDDGSAAANRMIATLATPTSDDKGELASTKEKTEAMAASLVDHLRERVFLLKTSTEREVLPPTLSPREQLALAAEKLGPLKVDVSGVAVTAPLLREVAATPDSQSVTKAMRVRTRRPVDVADLLAFLDDVLAQGYGMMREGTFVLTPGRARRTGVFVHPDDVFKKNKPRVYPAGKEFIAITEPKEPEGLTRAKNGERLGPNWYLRYKNPETERARMNDLLALNPKFGLAVKTLVRQLRRQGAEVSVESTVRAKERGFLMWGAFWLSRAKDEASLKKRISTLNKLEKKWELKVPIRWSAGETAATIRAARDMAETYGVVYATKRGAEKSDHYDGDAVDISAVGLPSRLTLKAPGKRSRTFDLSGDNETRDLSLSPQLVKYIERNFKMKKLKGDYPHWSSR